MRGRETESAREREIEIRERERNREREREREREWKDNNFIIQKVTDSVPTFFLSGFNLSNSIYTFLKSSKTQQIFILLDEKKVFNLFLYQNLNSFLMLWVNVHI